MAKSRSIINTSVPVRRETREEVLKPLLRGGERYDDLIRKMAAQYDPDAEQKTETLAEAE